ncbi:MAG TPA: hypothetical protein VFH08_06860 [Chitinophagaceae bacterium]|nr:hypothetical protein [Chitinophagaceae bacterium]
MKKLFNAVTRRQIKAVNSTQSVPFAINAQPVFYLIFLLGTFLFIACKKSSVHEPVGEEQAVTNKGVNAHPEGLKKHDEVELQTFFELQQVRAATAKYHDINNAFKDGYGTDPVVVMPQMGYHFLRMQSVSPVFDLRKPAFLVYNKKTDGSFELLAVEYGIPMSSLPLHVAPEGFTGNADEWDENTLNSGLWTLHAWVWKNNPDGVFNMTNPTVIVR